MDSTFSPRSVLREGMKKRSRATVMPTVPSEMPAVEGNRLLQPREETEKRGTWDGEAVSEVEVDAEEPEEGEKDESEGDDVLFVFHFAEFFVSTREMNKKRK